MKENKANNVKSENEELLKENWINFFSGAKYLQCFYPFH